MTDTERGGDDGREGSTSPPAAQDASTLHNYNLPPVPLPPPRALPTNPFQSTPLPATPSPTALPFPRNPLASSPRRAVQPQCLPNPALTPPPSSTGRAEPYKALKIRATPPHEIPTDRPPRKQPMVSKKRSKSENRKDGNDEKGGQFHILKALPAAIASNCAALLINFSGSIHKVGSKRAEIVAPQQMKISSQHSLFLQ
ncbi:hypothetical protein V6N13_071667 [Hibiscus sabdariffa]